MASRATTSRLSTWRLAGDAYDLWFSGFGMWMRAAGLPIALLILIDFASWQSLIGARQDGGPQPLAADLRFALKTIVDAIIFTLLGVSWHRWALLGERPSLLPPIGREHLRFLIWTLVLLFLSQFASGTILGLVLALTTRSLDMVLLGSLVAFVASLYFVARMSVIYPAAAIGQKLGLLAAWQMTRGQGWALFWALILVCIPLVAAFLLLGAFFGAALLGSIAAGVPGGGGLASGLAWLIPVALTAFFSLAFLSLPVGVASSAFKTLRSGVARPPSIGHSRTIE